MKVEKSAGRVKGVELADGRVLSAPVVVNVGGPNSHQVNEIAGVLDDFTISTRALRQEVHLLPAPPGYSLHSGSPFVTDADLGIYFGPQLGDRVLVGGSKRRATLSSGSTIPTATTGPVRPNCGKPTRSAWPAGCPTFVSPSTLLGLPAFTTPPMTGCPSTTARLSTATSSP